jgi:hypothetical protein
MCLCAYVVNFPKKPMCLCGELKKNLCVYVPMW